MKRKADGFDQDDDNSRVKTDSFNRGASSALVNGPISTNMDNLPYVTMYMRIPPGPDVVEDRLCCSNIETPGFFNHVFDRLSENVWSKTHIRTPLANLGQHKALAPDSYAVAIHKAIHNGTWIWVERYGYKKAANYAVIKEVLGADLSVAHMTFSSNGLYLLVLTRDGTVSIWQNNVTSLDCVDKGSKHQTWNTAVAVSGNGIHFTTSMVDFVIEVHNRHTKMKQQLKGHRAEVLCTAFSNDGAYLISGSMDCTVKIWDLASQVCIRSLCVPGTSPERIVFSPCNRFAAVWYPYGCVVIWECSTGYVIERIFLDEFIVSMTWGVREGLLICDVPYGDAPTVGIVAPAGLTYESNNIYCAFKTWKTPRWSLYSAILAGIINYEKAKKRGPWESFLMCGVYDPRLFMLIGAFGCNYLYNKP